MTKEDYKKMIDGYEEQGYTDCEKKLPEKDGRYLCIIKRGSMSVSYSPPTPKLFKRGAFPRMDWDYVILWKEEK